MYCPLCKAEYRAGFERCSDCNASLVQIIEEAQAATLVRLWKGTRASEFNAVVGALGDAGIPNRAESGASLNRGGSWRLYLDVFLIFRLLGWISGKNQTTSCKVFVLKSDYSTAKAILEKTISSSDDV